MISKGQPVAVGEKVFAVISMFYDSHCKHPQYMGTRRWEIRAGTNGVVRKIGKDARGRIFLVKFSWTEKGGKKKKRRCATLEVDRMMISITGRARSSPNTRGLFTRIGPVGR